VRAVVQRVENASVTVNGRIVGRIDAGLLVYVGIGKGDTEQEAAWLASKIAGIRIFPDQDYKMNLSVQDVGGSILAVSQFTLYGDVRKGRRPGYDKAASPETARTLYECFVERLKETGIPVATGEYQAVMDVAYINKGPVTLILETDSESSM